jgi:chemotaxis family two-component system sensor histidine kinase/response regulator PixL
VDAIFCDLCMPNMDGIGFLDAMQSRADLKSCPVIILTADARNARGSEALRRGARALLAKPFSPKAVSATLKDVLEPRATGPAGGGTK